MTDLLVDQLRAMARSFPDEMGYCLLDTGEAVTFAEWEAASNRLARGLVAAGIRRGDRVSIYLPDDGLLPWITAYPAIHKAGAVAVPTNTRLRPDELAVVLGHAEVTAALTSSALLAPLAGVADRLPSSPRLLSVDGGERATVWDEIASDDDSTFQVEVDPGDLADIMYTSGTTGTPKGVAVTHENLSLVAPSDPRFSGTGWLHGSPLFTFAGIGFVYNPMKLGMSGLYLARFDAGEWLRHVEEQRPAATFLVPAMANLLVSHPRFADADLSSITICAIGSAPLPFETLRAMQEKLPDAMVTNGYGMTEAGAAYCMMPPGESLKRPGSVGKPMRPTEVRVVDEDATDVPVGEEGEVLIRVPGQQRSYYKDPDATAAAWSGGWLHTGDVGRLDDDGYLYVVGRMKDVIIRGGHNVHATDVENVLHQHPAVLHAAVIGVPHQVLGEDIAAVVVTKDGRSVEPEELIAFCRERLADYKSPRRVVLRDDLPRNATGKVLKRELVAELGGAG